MTAHSLEILQAGLHTRLVDLGRPRWRALGVPVGGAADRASFLLGNALVGNPPGTAALEVALAGPTLVAGCALACVVTGAPFDVEGPAGRLAPGRTFTLPAGEPLRILGAARGARAYLCVAGGLDAPCVLGSLSSLGPLAAGARVGCQPGRVGVRWIHDDEGLFDLPGQVCELRVLEGGQLSWLGGASPFSEGDEGPLYTVGPQSDRMGLRLSGPPLPVPAREMTSEPVCPGTVQLTRDGQCIVLGMDGQTIGGYPRLAHVISADLDRLGQLRPGDRVRFRRVGIEEAEALLRRRRARLHLWQTRLRTAATLLS